MARRSTMADVAREAGVSLSTVDRALNRRAHVRSETLAQIAEAAERVGFYARGLVAETTTATAPRMRLGIILLESSPDFYQGFGEQIRSAVAARSDIRGTVRLRFVEKQTAERFAEELLSLGGEVDAIACVAINHQKVTLAVQDLKARGIPVIALLSDFAQGVRAHYVGTNNVKVGRAAAWMLTRAIHQPGKLALFVGGHRWHGHDLRELGFRAFVRESAPTYSILDTFVNLDAREVTYEATLDLLSRHSDLKGIYVAGGGMGGAIDALREARPPGRVALVVNELTPESQAALTDGYCEMVISTPLERLCADLVNLLIESVLRSEPGVPGQHFLPARLDVAEII